MRALRLRAFSDEDGVDHAVDVGAAERRDIGVVEAALQPAHLASFDTLCEAGMQQSMCGRRSDNNRRGAGGERARAAGASEGICAEDKVDVAVGGDGSEQAGRRHEMCV